MNGPAHISITLALPPSANKSWRPGIATGGYAAMFKRAPYKAWLNEAKRHVAIQAAGDRIPYRYHLRIVLPETLRDPDNSVKALSDALQHGGVISNDKHLRRLVLDVDPERDPTTALLELWALPDVTPPERPRKPVVAEAGLSQNAASFDARKQGVSGRVTVPARVGGSTFALPADKLPPGFRP